MMNQPNSLQSIVQKKAAANHTAQTKSPLLTLTSRSTKQAINDTSIKILGTSHVLRSQTEDFIKRVFKQHHNAQISSFLPELFAVFDESGNTKSVLGLRNAQCEALYLERYLDQPIETLIEQTAQPLVRRGQIVEIGNLASLNSASCKVLFSFITQHLQDQNIKWITCTGTTVLRLVFRRLGIKAWSIHEADQSRLGDEQYEWGSYYDNDPHVMLINVQETNQHFIEAAKARDCVISH